VIDLFGNEIQNTPTKKKKKKGYWDEPGSGPDGKQCRDCERR